MMIELLLPLALMASVVSASVSDFDQHHPTCFLDRIERCKNIDGLAAIFQCLDQHQNQISPSCQASLDKSPAFRCSFDSMLLCPEAKTHYDLMACLWSHSRDHLSSRCINSDFSGQKDHDSGIEFKECHQDQMKFCHEVSGPPRVMSCLADHESELSSECRTALQMCPVFKCAHDAGRFCPDVKEHRDLIKCIWDHRSEVSAECKEVMSDPPSTLLAHHHSHRHRDQQPHHHHDRHNTHRNENHHIHHPKHHDRHHHEHHDHRKRHHGERDDQHFIPAYRHKNDEALQKKRHKEHHRHRHHHHHHHHDPESHFKACKFDVRRFCYTVDGFVDKMACLASHEDELSDSCRMVMSRCPAFHCAHDVQKFCPGVKNKHEFIGCLWEHRHELSDECMNQDNSDGHNDDDNDGDDDDGNHQHSEDKCRHEREKMCQEDQRKSPEYDVACLSNQNQDDLSEGCRESLHLRVSCKDDVNRFCNNERSYPLKCLKRHRNDLADNCKEALGEKASRLTSDLLWSTASDSTVTMTSIGAMVLIASIVITLGILTWRKRKAYYRAASQYQRI